MTFDGGRRKFSKKKGMKFAKEVVPGLGKVMVLRKNKLKDKNIHF